MRWQYRYQSWRDTPFARWHEFLPPNVKVARAAVMCEGKDQAEFLLDVGAGESFPDSMEEKSV